MTLLKFLKQKDENKANPEIEVRKYPAMIVDINNNHLVTLNIMVGDEDKKVYTTDHMLEDFEHIKNLTTDSFLMLISKKFKKKGVVKKTNWFRQTEKDVIIAEEAFSLYLRHRLEDE